MLKAISEWFQEQIGQSQQHDQQSTVELATAVLLYEIMRADEKFEEAEQLAFNALLEGHFSLQPDAVQLLVEASKHEAKHAVDFQTYTRVINQQCNVDEKRKILHMLWRLAYADRHIDVHESHLIRRISDLLHIPHSEFIQTKLTIIDANQAN
ncbi:TerB family tellurite resistance protein [Aliiglaciecola sp. LCG003]|uniref:tellurite resistance TerB family protein n=1 Tax=Aliiglaciecola sp. LCG003 TaxID=3053655 RepID=UPI00257486AB|nr:TerB family tellurite resistance protein [Aliiglaciecola sp. LCG003]WJG08122.1 TerB family tellurite resistance protein [Aliiglaciecola sp. LCG003]